MFVVLDDGCDEAELVSASDQLTAATALVSPAQPLHYLFRGANVSQMPDAVVENAASIDGAVVLRRNGDLVAVGAILRSDGGLALTARLRPRGLPSRKMTREIFC